MWVRSEYAGELAVFSTWLCALMPWAVTVSRDLSLVLFWFLPGSLLFGVSAERPFWVTAMPDFYAEPVLLFMSYAWVAGAVLFFGALGFSLVYYFDTERVEALSVDQVRVLGASLLGTGVLVGISYLLLWVQHPGVHLPPGIGFLVLFGGVLLTIDRTEPGVPGE